MRMRIAAAFLILEASWAGISTAAAAPSSPPAGPQATVAVSKFKTLFNNFRHEETWRWESAGFVASGSDASGGRDIVAFAFTAAEDSVLRRIELALRWISGTNAFTVSMRTDVGGLPGELLHTFEVADAPPSPPACCDYVKLATHGIALTEGRTYWIVVKAYGDTIGAWFCNNIGDEGPIAFKRHGHEWYKRDLESRGAMHLLGTATQLADDATLDDAE